MPFLIGIAIGIFPVYLNAAMITGVLSVSGLVQVDATSMDFLPDNGGIGEIQANATGQTGYFSGLAGNVGSAKDLDVAGQPVDMPFSLAGFLTFASMPDLSFELTYILPGSGTMQACGAPASAGQSCTLTGSPFTLTNVTGSSSIASLVLQGLVRDGSGGPVSKFVGAYSMSFPSQSLQEVLATLSSDGSVTQFFTANFDVAAIPEPGTLPLLLVAGLALSARRSQRKQFCSDPQNAAERKAFGASP